MLESKPNATSSELESALTSLFTGILGVADRTSVVCNEHYIKVEIHNPCIETRATWSHHCLGGPLASIAASLVAEAWDKPVTIKQEEHHKKKYSILLELIG